MLKLVKMFKLLKECLAMIQTASIFHIFPFFTVYYLVDIFFEHFNAFN